MNGPIDIVIPWVDGADPKWIIQKEDAIKKYSPEKNSYSNIRFESWDNLHLWFRAIERFMPWVNKIHFITWGHIPAFLNINHPKLNIVRHEDYIPKEYLPTYNSNTIEMNYYRIPNLAENYIIFNDDMIPLRENKEEYYFKNNKICDEAVENIVVTASFGAVSNMARYTQINNMMIINHHFKKREVQKRNWDKWYCEEYGELLERTKSLQYWNDFPGIHDPHMPSAMKKSTLEKLWLLEREVLDTASRNHFRAYNDVTQYLIRYWQLCEGEFYPRKTLGKCYFVDIMNVEQVVEDICMQKEPMVCINENCVVEEFGYIKSKINQALEKILPEKSSFEK